MPLVDTMTMANSCEGICDIVWRLSSFDWMGWTVWPYLVGRLDGRQRCPGADLWSVHADRLGRPCAPPQAHNAGGSRLSRPHGKTPDGSNRRAFVLSMPLDRAEHALGLVYLLNKPVRPSNISNLVMSNLKLHGEPGDAEILQLDIAWLHDVIETDATGLNVGFTSQEKPIRAKSGRKCFKIKPTQAFDIIPMQRFSLSHPV